LIFQTPTVLTTGTTAQSLATRLTLTETLATFATGIQVPTGQPGYSWSGTNVGIYWDGGSNIILRNGSIGAWVQSGALLTPKLDIGGNGDLFLTRAAAADLQFGLDVNGAAVSQTLRAPSGITGTDKTGGNFTVASGKGTGAGAVSSIIFQTPTVLTTGTTAQTLATRLTLTETLSTFTTPVAVPDDAYGSGWNGSVNVPTKNAVYDKIQTLVSAPTMIFATIFETAARFTTSQGLLGANTFFGGADKGLLISSGATLAGYARTKTQIGNNDLLIGSPSFTSVISTEVLTAASGAGSMYLGLGDISVDGTLGQTFTGAHIGFKIIKTGGVVSLYATQADGATETASAALTTLADYDGLVLIAKLNGSSSVDYYYRKNGSALSSATNLTTNLPTGPEFNVQWSTTNKGTAFNFAFSIVSFSYER
jgi:hypothetical protein